MKRFKDFLKSKGFYIALSIGIVAFAGLMIAYNYGATTDKLSKEPAIDLNQPVVEEKDNNILEDYEEAGSDGVVSDKEAKEMENFSSEEEIENSEDNSEIVTELSTKTDATQVIVSEENTEIAETEMETEDVMAELNYEGEQSLTWPLVGDVILPYSMDTTIYFKTLDTYKCNPGILVQGDEGADIVAAYDGKVLSIEDSKEFGTVVSIDMGNGYLATYGQLMNVCVEVGDTVSTSENIGEVAPVSSYYVEEGNHLYFAITKDGEPVNPINLIK